MKFEEALSAMREGKSIKIKIASPCECQRHYTIYPYNILDFPHSFISWEHIVREDWEICE